MHRVSSCESCVQGDDSYLANRIKVFEIVQILLSQGKEKGIRVNMVDLGGFSQADCTVRFGNIELLALSKEVSKHYQINVR